MKELLKKIALAVICNAAIVAALTIMNVSHLFTNEWLQNGARFLAFTVLWITCRFVHMYEIKKAMKESYIDFDYRLGRFVIINRI